MKISYTTIIFIFILSLNLNAQSQWKFHVAYEDAIGARDTIWFIWDTSATFYGLDTALGENIIFIDTSVFNVWTYNPSSTTYDTIKTLALPYTYPSLGQTIEAINFELPITISWDSSLLHADWLPPEPVGWINCAYLGNDYFFLVNNNGSVDHVFDITLDDHVMAPDTNITDPWFWLPERHFPMSVFLTQDPYLSMPNFELPIETPVTIYPNPVLNTLFLKKNKSFDQAQILDMNGKTYLKITFHDDKNSINVSTLPPGIYILHVICDQNNNYYEKFIKTN